MFDVLRQHHISFKNAFAGLFWALRTQPNFRVHIVCAILALLFGVYFKISHIEMAIILFTILLGLSGEMINTALESMTDLITREWRKEAKIAKDVAAGMMLLIAFGAIGIAGFIFTPYIYSALSSGAY
jgi:diacylglycerol kinase (ATP)